MTLEQTNYALQKTKDYSRSELKSIMDNHIDSSTIISLGIVFSIVTAISTQLLSFLTCCLSLIVLFLICLVLYYQIQQKRITIKRMSIPYTQTCKEGHAINYYSHFCKHNRLKSTHYAINPSAPTIIQVRDVYIIAIF